MYEIGKDEITELEKLFLSRKLFRYQGKSVETNTSLFEKEFSHYIGQPHSLFVTSGTNAIFLALRAIGIKAGDEVLVPVYAFVATVAAIQHVGATPVLVSVGNDLTLDVDKIREKITSKTKCIIPVHMDGFHCDMQKISSLASEYNIFVVEDVAQAIGGSLFGRKLGSFGDASCFSFNVDKIITCGEGGVVSFKNEQNYKSALILHDAPVRFGATFKDEFSHSDLPLGYSMRVSEVSSVIMRQQLKKLDLILKNLRDRKRIFVQELKSSQLQMILPQDLDGDCSTHLHFKFEDPLIAKEWAKKLTDQGILAYPLYVRPAYCFWQWIKFLELTKNQEEKAVIEFSENRFFLSSVVKVDIKYDESLESTTEMALSLKKFAKSICS
jgi:dTDP-4-amino-4,6-dideoxygalactose transaminase